LEFYLNLPKGISIDDIEKIVTNRASFEDVWGKITKPSLVTASGDICGIGGTCTGSTISDVVFTKDAFKKHWDSRRIAEYAVAHYNLGNALLDKGRISEAISHYKTAIKLKPDYADAHNNLGIALVAEGKIEEAISHYKMAIKIKPDYVEAHNNLGNALFQKGEMKEAIDHYREALKLKPDLVAAQKNLEMALLRSEELE
jgi:tetratricopeptide (TPR) repeat protein